jgi:hypothetical protein
MEEWCRKVRRSGYPSTIRHQVIKSSFERYERMCLEEDSGVRPIHRSRTWKMTERRREKELKKTTWHKRGENQVSAPLFLDPTSGAMTKQMKEVCRKFEDVTGWRVPVIERAGNSVRSIAKAEPLKAKGCKRADCFPCSSSGGNCERNGSGYRIICKTFQLDGIDSVYEGETGRNGYTRGKEHVDALTLEDEENALWKHCLVQNNGEKAVFSMEVLGIFYTCLVRQVNEGVKIQRSKEIAL